jgi:hypothetical protein
VDGILPLVLEELDRTGWRPMACDRNREHAGEFMTSLPFVLLGVLIGAWFLSSKIMRITVAALASPRERMTPAHPCPFRPGPATTSAQTEDWAREHGFEDDVMFDFQIASKEHTLFCRTWKNAGEKTYLVFYYGMGKHFMELVTIYDDKTGVTTTNAPDAHTLPAVPGAFIQSFPETGLTDCSDCTCRAAPPWNGAPASLPRIARKAPSTSSPGP